MNPDETEAFRHLMLWYHEELSNVTQQESTTLYKEQAFSNLRIHLDFQC